MWKSLDFSLIQILREIKGLKSIFAILETLNFVILVDISLKKVQKFKK